MNTPVVADLVPAGLLPGLLLLAVAGVAVSALLVRRVIRLAVMDVPGDRSAHERPTPRGGGIGAVAAVLAGVPIGLLLLFRPEARLVPVALLLGSVLVLATVSWLDDLRQFPPALKLAAQCAASAGAVLSALHGHETGLAEAMPAALSGLASPGFCLVGFCWLMLCTNAVNFMDGLNGLAAGVCALCGAVMLPIGLVVGDPLLAIVGLMLAAGLLGFLPFNFPHARIFMGDVGSQVCGLLVGWFALALLADTARPLLALAVPLMLAGLLCDVVFTLARRIWSQERITQAHRGHLYQVAARSGLARSTVAIVQWGFALWGALVSMAMLPVRPVVAVLMVLLPQLSWGLSVRQRARRAGLDRWS